MPKDKKVFREVDLVYDGQTYTLTPSNKLMRRIDGGLYPQTLFSVIGVMKDQQLPLPAIAYIICEFLKEAGCEGADEDEVVDYLTADLHTNGGAEVMQLIELIAECVTPASVASNPPAVAPAVANQTGAKGKSKGKRKTPARR